MSTPTSTWTPSAGPQAPCPRCSGRTGGVPSTAPPVCGIQESAIRRGWPPSAGAFFPGSFHTRGLSLRGPSRPVGESGSDNLRDEYYLLVFVLHEQSDSITHEIERYEQFLRDKGLPGISLHSGLLLTGHEGYEDMPLADRKRLLSSFRILFRNLPARHVCAALRLLEYGNMGHVEAAMRRGEPPPRQPRGIPHKERSSG